MFIPHHNLQLLSPNTVRLRPIVIIFLQYLLATKEETLINIAIQNPRNHKIGEKVKICSRLGIGHDAAGLLEYGGGEVDLLANHSVVLVVGVVGVAELAVGSELEFQELVPEFPLVPHVVTQVELVFVVSFSHCWGFEVSVYSDVCGKEDKRRVLEFTYVYFSGYIFSLVVDGLC